MRAFVTGITGQDGSYLAELLLKKGYEVFGVVRRSSTPNLTNIQNLLHNSYLHLEYGDITDGPAMTRLVQVHKPTEIYNIAAQSDVRISFDMPAYTMNTIAVGTMNLLEAARESGAKFYQASTSEMYGKVQATPQNEKTPFYPRSPYGCAKLAAHWATVNYRESYDLHACCGILFNHESPRRGLNFVTRKITHGMMQIKMGKQFVLELGNLSALRDWGHAKDYVRGMWQMLQTEIPDDYVLATGETHTVREFATIAGRYFGFDLEWVGEGEAEKGIDRKTGHTIVQVNPYFYRPAEVEILQGDPSHAEKELGWQREYSFEALVEDMCRNE